MKKLLAFALVGVSMLCLATGSAFAWPLRHCWRCCHRHCCHECCTQYNAFSPWCCDSGYSHHHDCGCCNGNGHGDYYPGPYAYYGANGYAGHLPYVGGAYAMNSALGQPYAANGMISANPSIQGYAVGQPYTINGGMVQPYVGNGSMVAQPNSVNSPVTQPYTVPGTGSVYPGVTGQPYGIGR